MPFPADYLNILLLNIERIIGMWILGIMGLVGLEINIMTYIVPTLLFIIGIGDAIHIQARFRENYSNNPHNPIEAMLNTMRQMSRVIFLTSITTSKTFILSSPLKSPTAMASPNSESSNPPENSLKYVIDVP